MERSMLSILAHHKSKSTVEKAAAIILKGCAIVSIIAVLSITAYMFISGTPALFKVGLTDILFGQVWAYRDTSRVWNFIYYTNIYFRSISCYRDCGSNWFINSY